MTYKKKNGKKNNEQKQLLPHEEYSSLYKDLLSCGKTEEEAQEICNSIKQKEQLHLDKYKGKDKDTGEHTSYRDKRFKVRLSYPVEQLREVISNYDHMDKRCLEKALWQLGYDTKSYPYYLEQEQYRDKTNKVVWGDVLVGSERLDGEWLSKRINGKLVASDEAIWYSRSDLIEVMKENSKRG